MFQPGQSGNPKGSPKKLDTISGMIRSMLDGIKPDDPDKRKHIICIAHDMVEKSYKDIRYLELLLSYGFGKPQANVDLTSNNETLNTFISESFVADTLTKLMDAEKKRLAETPPDASGN